MTDKINNQWIILDIDGTLSLTIDEDEYQDLSEDIQQCFNKIIYKKYENKDITSDAWVMIRPYLDEFMDFIFKHFNVGVWSIGQPGYVNTMVNHLFKSKGYQPLFVNNFTHCRRCYDPIRFTKPLEESPGKGGLIIDDNQDVVSEGDDYIIVSEFDMIYGDPDIELLNDIELLDLMDQLEIFLKYKF